MNLERLDKRFDRPLGGPRLWVVRGGGKANVDLGDEATGGREHLDLRGGEGVVRREDDPTVVHSLRIRGRRRSNERKMPQEQRLSKGAEHY